MMLVAMSAFGSPSDPNVAAPSSNGFAVIFRFTLPP